MELIQGTNKPITLTFSEEVDFSDMSVELVNFLGIIKEWKKDELIINGPVVICPLAQEETINFPEGGANLEIKWIDDGVTEFADLVEIDIVPRMNQTILEVE